ncbi:putative LPS assembly protein LptD [Arcticibacterium luteifluviistationis]|uniref:Organic solvent tolerance protein OstA n=1 Tax=Arcticibacterium luteifluviistationis TaxID=1784714 RepID=A0A2Z4GDJ9_9BACT|nr:putative LPS assembly protein LptD [Arcticibacterium luteifluviistationis]AWV99234.1 organic solvent tolerance protein OstA [Arcticibacterium luteifluviistationis]
MSTLSYAQVDSLAISQDTTSIRKSIIADSLVSAENNLETTVVYSAEDSTIMDVDGETIYLYGNGSVDYGDISLKADFIQISWGKSEVFAHGMPDSTKLVGEKVKGKPIFTQGADSYNTDTIRYNFTSRKAIIKGIVTQEGEGIIQGEKVKKDPKDNLYLVNAKYSTCDLAEPHFHIAAKKIKLVNKRSIISGPFNLVLAGIPLPIGFPFGFFPVPKKKEIGTSGFIMGSYGEEPNSRGYYFRDFGYYHAFNEYIGAKVLAQIYSKGSFGLGVQSQYTKKYKYSGNVNVQFTINKPTDELSLSETSRDFNVSWSHSPQNKRPDRSFSASVNLVSNGFSQNNVRLDAVDQYTSNTFGSSIQYSKDFGKLIRTSAALRINQNVSTKVLNGSSTYSLAVSQFNPFVPEKKQIGKWYESFRVGVSVNGGYTVSNQSSSRSTSYNEYNIAGVSNEPITTEEERRKLELEQLLSLTGLTDEERLVYQEELEALDNPVIEGLSNILNNGVFNTSYNVPISLPNIKIAKYINLTPSISYKGDFFTKELDYQFVNPGIGPQVVSLNDGRTVTVQGIDGYDSLSYSYDDLQNLTVLTDANGGGVVVIDTLNKPSFGQSYSFGTSLNTRVYGTYRFNGNGRMQAIRHTVSPSMSVSYTPNTDGQYAYKTIIRQDSVGTITEKYLPRFVNSTASTGSASANLSFGISNQLEAKMRSKSDTAQNEFEKVSLLDNFSINSSYNLMADEDLGEFALSNINLSANSSLFKGLIRLNMGGTIDPYKYVTDDLISSNLAGTRIPTFKWVKDNENPGLDVGDYLSSYNMSVNTTLNPKTFNKDKKSGKETDENVDPARAAMEKFVKANPMAYVDFSVPWSLTVAYTLNYSKQGLADARVTQALSFRGDFSLTQKWKFTYSTGWDFVYKAVTLTNVGMMRELHCWDMSFNWTPISGNTSRASNYSFDLRVRSSLLSDLKISRRRQYYDRGGF